MRNKHRQVGRSEAHHCSKVCRLPVHMTRFPSGAAAPSGSWVLQAGLQHGAIDCVLALGSLLWWRHVAEQCHWCAQCLLAEAKPDLHPELTVLDFSSLTVALPLGAACRHSVRVSQLVHEGVIQKAAGPPLKD